MIDSAYMTGPLGALMAAAKILGLPIVKISRGHYRIRADNIALNNWILAKHKMDNWIDNNYHRTVRGSRESCYRLVKP